MVNTGDTAWVLTSASLVLLMTPGLALFYGGMVRVKSALNMMMMSFGALGLISVLWVLYGYSLAFGNDVGGGLLGSPTEFLGLRGLLEDTTSVDGGLPAMAFVGFQAVFAIITVALVSGAVAERMKFGAWMVFAGVWATVVYFPVAHWVFDFSAGDHVGGWIANTLGAIDFAGGTAVHINAGAAALALALVLGTRRGFGTEAMRPHNLPLVMLGAGLLWFGWFGFNAGSALAANHTAAIAWVNTLVAPAAASLAWIVTERIRDGYATSLGAASGLVAGLVAITPACCGSAGSASTPAPPSRPTTPPPSPGSTRWWPPQPPASRGSSPSGSVTGTPPRWAPRRAWSPAWWPSPRHARRCPRSAPSSSASAAACSARWPSA